MCEYVRLNFLVLFAIQQYLFTFNAEQLCLLFGICITIIIFIIIIYCCWLIWMDVCVCVCALVRCGMKKNDNNMNCTKYSVYGIAYRVYT